MSVEQVQKVQAAHEDEWASLPGFEGVGIGECDGEPCIKIFVSKQTEAINALEPIIDGVKIVVEVTGEFRALE